MRSRPLLRGVSHELAFFASLPLGAALALQTETATGRIAAIAYGATVAFMFGASAGIYGLIAGSYTPIGLLVLHGSLRLVVLSIVWGGAAAAILLKVFWVEAPKWLAAAIGIGLGWVGVIVLPEVATRVGLTGCLLIVGGGLLYTAGALVYAFRRPNPAPSIFGYHELFHALVIGAVALQYSAIAFYVLRGH